VSLLLAPDPNPARPLLATLVVRFATTALLLVAVALPALAYWATRPPGPVAKQIQLGPVPESEIVRLEGHDRDRPGIPVITYHRIAEDGGPYSVRPDAFNEQIAALRAAGYQTITTKQFADYVAGRRVRLPRKPLLIMFDDGLKSVWVYADQVMKRYGFRGAVFTITGRVSTHQPYYLTWEEIERMHASGRWDFEAHTHDGHRRVRIDPRGHQGAFLTHLRWLPRAGRRETLAEYGRRIERDFKASKERLRAHGLPEPRMVAFPFSTSAYPTNDPRIPQALRDISFRNFATALDNVGYATSSVPAKAQYLHRLEVVRSTRTRGLLRELSEARPHKQQTQAGKEVVYDFLDRYDKATADALLRDEYRLPRFEPVRIPRVTWREDPFREVYWRFHFYSLRPAGELLAAYNATGDERYRHKLLEHLRNYTAHDRRRGGRGLDRNRLDYPYGAAFRAMVLINAYKKLDRIGELPADLRRDLTWSIDQLGTFLNEPRNFQPATNQGFAQATALLLIAENFPRLEGAPVWRGVADARLAQLMNRAVDEDGVQIERSPFYHFYVLRLATELTTWADEHGVTLPTEFRSKADAMVRFATYVTLPDGKLPLQGSSVDTNVAKLEPQVFVALGQRHPEFEYVRTGGLAGRPPAKRLAVFESSGDAFLRSDFGGPNNFDRSTHMAFNIGPQRTSHAHHDALHLTYYSAGRSLLPDSGLFTYGAGRDHDFFWSTRAHNTVVVDGRDQPKGPVRQGIGATGRDWSYKSGAHSLYPGVTHSRSVVLLQRDLALVVDALSSRLAHNYDQTWHLLPGVELRRRGLDVTAVAQDGRPLVALHQAAPRGTRLTDRIGKRAPLQGWHSKLYGRKQPNHALKYSLRARNARFATLIASGRLATAPAHVTLTETPDGLRATVCAHATHRFVAIARPGQGGERAAVTAAPASACRR
jgi:peptidoglycan/xylan/chitin deacetylase (PgdA/CDA1 family)